MIISFISFSGVSGLSASLVKECGISFLILAIAIGDNVELTEKKSGQTTLLQA
jgi:hypothetical protein